MKLFTVKKPVVGDTRTRTTFAFFPTKVFDRETRTHQWIWFERYHVNQVFKFDWSSWGGEYTWVTEIRYI